MIDLHGQHVTEALRIVERELAQRRAPSAGRARSTQILVGTAHHYQGDCGALVSTIIILGGLSNGHACQLRSSETSFTPEDALLMTPLQVWVDAPPYRCHSSSVHACCGGTESWWCWPLSSKVHLDVEEEECTVWHAKPSHIKPEQSSLSVLPCDAGKAQPNAPGRGC